MPIAPLPSASSAFCHSKAAAAAGEREEAEHFPAMYRVLPLWKRIFQQNPHARSLYQKSPIVAVLRETFANAVLAEHVRATGKRKEG